MPAHSNCICICKFNGKRSLTLIFLVCWLEVKHILYLHFLDEEVLIEIYEIYLGYGVVELSPLA